MAVYDGDLLDPGQPLYEGQRVGRTFAGEMLFDGGSGAAETYYYRVGSGNAVATTDLSSVPAGAVVTRSTC